MLKPHVPSYFERGLAVIDKTYRVLPTDDHDGYYIVKDVSLSMKIDGGKTLSQPKAAHVHGPLVVLFFPEFGEQVLEKLREMKKQALEMGIYDNPMKELAFYQAQKIKAKKKKAELAVDMVSEGLMEADRLSRKKSFSYGGS